MEQVMHAIAENIKRRRKLMGLTQEDLAEKLGYSKKAVSKWERGGGTPPTVLLPKLAAILGTTPDGLLSATTEMHLYLGIDGGGTKTDFVLANAEGEVLHRTILGGSNPNDIGMHAAQGVLKAGILEVCGEYPHGSISTFAGIAGGTTANNAQEIGKFLARFGFAHSQNGSDAMCAIAAGLGEEDGIAVIMGTGAIAFAQQKGMLYRVGGYGSMFGEDGSGFALGKDAVLAALQYEDGSGPQTMLYDAVLAQCNTETVLQKVGDFYREGKRLAASFAPLVFRACEQGDLLAQGLLQKHAQAVVRLIRGAARHIEGKPIKVALCGGLVQEELLLHTIRQMLEDTEYFLYPCKAPMVTGALYLAGLDRSKTVVL